MSAIRKLTFIWDGKDEPELTEGHRSNPHQCAEARDITLSELAIPFPLHENGKIEPEFGPQG